VTKKSLCKNETEFRVPFNHRVLFARTSYSGVYGVFSGIDSRRAIVPPIGLGYIASVVREGNFDGDPVLRGKTAKSRYDVLPMLDNEIYHESPAAFAERILAYNPSVVGISSATPSFAEAQAIAVELKERNPDVITINGGPHVNSITDFVNDKPNDFSSRMTLVLKDLDPRLLSAQKEALRQLVLPGQFDYAITKEGEYTTLHLLEILNHGGSLNDVQNLIYQRWDNGTCHPIKTNDKAYVSDTKGRLDCLPRQAYDLMEMEEYNHPIAGYGMQPMGAFQTARGCPQACSFCHVDFGRTIRFMSAEKVLDEMEYLMHRFGRRWLTIYDDTYTWPDKIAHREGRDPLERIKLISRGIIERGYHDEGLRYQVFMRANMVDADALKEIVESGVHTISIGVESGDDQVLKNIGKGTNLLKVQQAMQRLFEYVDSFGIEVRASFILGLPGETRDSILRTFDVLGESGLPMHRVNVNIATPLPGTRLYNEALLEQRVKFVEEVKPSDEVLPDWSTFRRHGNAIIEVLDEKGETVVSPDELIQLQKKAHEVFYTRRDTLRYHMNQVRKLIDLGGDPKDDAYYYRPVFFAVRELLGIDRKDLRLKQVHDDNFQLTRERVDRWEAFILDQDAHRTADASDVVLEMSDAFGFHGQDPKTDDGRKTVRKVLMAEQKLGGLQHSAQQRQDPLIVSHQGLE
jgi:anaerobic magnesium-protoporphyrin IX monomethyl ester cyclase